tara:strand:+ start:185 stop:490 length:306 start_codon:yes stop_codon:yes gene_type:complete
VVGSEQYVVGAECAHLAHLAAYGALLLLPFGAQLVALLELRRRLHLLDHANLVPHGYELVRVLAQRRLGEAHVRRPLAHEGEVELAVAQQRVLFEELVELA